MPWTDIAPHASQLLVLTIILFCYSPFIASLIYVTIIETKLIPNLITRYQFHQWKRSPHGKEIYEQITASKSRIGADAPPASRPSALDSLRDDPLLF